MVDETEFDVMDADHESRLEDSELHILDECNCRQEYSIEVHGENMALYFGRCIHRHGMNLCTISDMASNCHLDVIEGLLNRGITR